MVKSSLENVVLKVKNLNMGSPKSILALAIDPPKLSLITRAVANLKEVRNLVQSKCRVKLQSYYCIFQFAYFRLFDSY